MPCTSCAASSASSSSACVCIVSALNAVWSPDARLIPLASPQIAEDYSTARLLLRLPGYSPMPAFGNVVDVPLVTRKARRSRAEVRAGLGVSDDAKLVLYQFGGQVNALHASASPRRLDAN